MLFYGICHRLLYKFLDTIVCRHLFEHDVCCNLYKWVCIIFWLFYLLKILFTYLYIFPPNNINKRSMPEMAFFVFGLFSEILRTSSLYSSGNILITLFIFCVNISPSENILIYFYSFINENNSSSLIISAVYYVSLFYCAYFVYLSDSSIYITVGVVAVRFIWHKETFS